MTDACLIEVCEHETLVGAAETVAFEAADWLGYRSLSGTVSVALPGAACPQALLEHLAARPIAWDRVTITTTEEHRVPEGHHHSCIGAVRRAFAGWSGSQARFVSLGRPDAAASIKLPLDLVVLSLGSDGQLACFPPCAMVREDASRPFVDFVRRPSAIELPLSCRRWGLPELVSSQRAFLLSAGATSKTAIDHALRNQDDSPLGAWFGQARGVVSIHWAES
ncbi:6-phosphogluconolactonase [Sphingomonas sp.]|uniref:6-phosphogluconolactonase n=1 Tax=Sphingomonas sp. TaxID=28214 RepID=UPI0025E0E8E6|nr:6-phosphogluconolactonase [Sphingomonas sp.]MBV9526761.1 6-phosphogluconolactonase [Sphingomonas sp.]